MTVLIDGKLEDPLIKDKKVSLLGGVICGQKISMGSVSEGSSCGDWPKFSGKGEYDHQEFIDWLDNTKYEFNMADRYITTKLPLVELYLGKSGKKKSTENLDNMSDPIGWLMKQIRRLEAVYPEMT
ncbi:hypothetical protein BY996DRAFT_6455043 [Phakopsora pachyrhizi]|nr:hypothetical protein BY996DRAFT_6455043 [Phakopsora pachyrhizi]